MEVDGPWNGGTDCWARHEKPLTSEKWKGAGCKVEFNSQIHRSRNGGQAKQGRTLRTKMKNEEASRMRVSESGFDQRAGRNTPWYGSHGTCGEMKKRRNSDLVSLQEAAEDGEAWARAHGKWCCLATGWTSKASDMNETVHLQAELGADGLLQVAAMTCCLDQKRVRTLPHAAKASYRQRQTWRARRRILQDHESFPDRFSAVRERVCVLDEVEKDPRIID